MYKRFCIKFIILVLILTAAVFALCDFAIKNCKFAVVNLNTHSFGAVYYKFWMQRKIEIAKNKSSQGRKVVFLGGSSTMYGINAKEIEDTFKIPTVNFGLHAGYPYIIFDAAKKILNKGDIVIIALEAPCYMAQCQSSLDDLEIEYLFQFDKGLYKNFDLKRKLSCIYYVINNLFGIRPEKTIKKIEQQTSPYFDNSYSIKYWNDNGDNIYEREQKDNNTGSTEKKVPKFNQKYFSKKDMMFLKNKNSYLNNFMQYAKENNIKVIFIAPALALDIPKEKIKYYNLKELWEYAGYDYIDNIEDSFYDKKYSFDGATHLTTEGAKLRTKQIIDLFDKYNVIQ